VSASWPTVWDAFLTFAAAALPGLQIVDGETGTYLAFDYLQVTSVEGTDTPATIGLPIRYNEAYRLNCLLRAYAGNVDPSARRARAAALYGALRDALVADPSMGGAVNGRAYLTNYRLVAGPTEKGGSAADVEFAVEITNQTLS
jgi:hypothetical protein